MKANQKRLEELESKLTAELENKFKAAAEAAATTAEQHRQNQDQAATEINKQ